MSFAEFIREKRLLANVTAKTVEWYEYSFHWLDSETPTQDDLKACVMRMREKGLKATGVNCVARAINTYLHWMHAEPETKCSPSCKHPKIAKLKEPQNVLPVFSETQVKQLIVWKPQKKYERRLHALILFLMDSGCRISEALALRCADVDLENLLLKITGKGRKQRLIPFSFELRRTLMRYFKEFERKPESLVFANRNETMLSRRNVLRDVKALCKRLGFDAPERTLHSFRHSFAVNYLRRGGSVFHLQKMLGHTTLDMTRRYANLVTSDLQAVHERVSLLSS